MPRLYIISGCNGAGKTTASYTMLPEMLDCSEFVNSDEFAKGLSPFNPEKASIQASRYMIMKIRYLLKRQQDFGIETTLATRTLLKTIRIAQEAGYTVTLLYFWLNSPELAVERVAARVGTGGHDIPEETIRRRYRVGIDYFFHDYAPICERWILADNSQIPFRVIAEGSKNDLINIKDEATYEQIRKVALERHDAVLKEQQEHKMNRTHE
ncbi:MAG: zeta toxin family protein [Bacteroidales bacterium]|nr:zeta toxin family protein [Bacteroidales bacterium]